MRIAWLANDPANTYDGAALDGASEVAENNRATVAAYYSGYNPTVQLQQCMDILSSGQHDAIIVIPADSNAIIPCVTAAKERKVPVVAVDLPIGPDITTVEPQVPGQVGAVLIPGAQWGQDLATMVADVCSRQDYCDVGYLAGSFGSALDQGALAELDALAATHPNIRILGRGEAFWTRSIATGVAATMLAEHPTINLIIGAGDQMAQGVEDVISAQVPPPDPIKLIVGAGAGVDGVQAVREGRWYGTYVALPRDEGTYGADIAIRAARRQTIADPGINPLTLRGWPAFFTIDNQDQFVGFEPQWQ